MSDQLSDWPPKSKPFRRVVERGIVGSLVGCGLVSVFVTFAIVFVLFQQTAGFFGLHGADTPGKANVTEEEHAAGVRPSDVEPASALRLNEVRVTTPGEDRVGYVEVGGPEGASLGGHSLVVIGSDEPAEGAPTDSGRVLASVSLDGLSLDANGVALIGSQASFFGSSAGRVALELSQPPERAITYALVRGSVPGGGVDLDGNDDGTLDTPLAGVVDAVAMRGETDPSEQGFAYPALGNAEAEVIEGIATPSHVYRSVEGGAWETSNEPPTYVKPTDFLFGLEWNPLLGADKHFGIWPLIGGTLLVTAVAMLVAIPGGLMTAIYLSEYAPRRLRAFLKPVLEVLAGIPTVVYGFFALTVITPTIRNLAVWVTGDPIFEVYNAFSAGVAVGIMCLPIVCSLSEDALQAVPKSLREGAYGLGSTRFDVSVKIVLPAALSGIVAAVLLAVARSVGETMIVALAAGGSPLNLIADDGGFNFGAFAPTAETQTMTAYMVQIFLGDASNFGPEYLSAYSVGTALFVLTLILTLIGGRVLKKFREEYE